MLLQETAVVENEKYELGEIARIDGADSRFIEKLQRAVIGQSPLPGRELTVTRSIILSRLRSRKIDTRRVHFPGAQSARIQRAALMIPGTDIDQTVLDHIRKTNRNSDIKPRLLAKSRDLYLPRGEVSYRIDLKGRHRKEGGYRTYEVVFSVDGKEIRKVPVRTYLKLYKEVVIARDTIKRDHIITGADLMKVRRNVDRMPSQYITSEADIIGRIASRAINPKEVISKNTVDPLPLVKPGDRLLIVYETPSLRLSAPGVSLQKGMRGERIQVRNLESRIVVYATVRDGSIVQVN